MIKITKQQKSLTKEDVELLISLVRSLKSELISFKEMGAKVSIDEYRKVSHVEKKLGCQLAYLSS